MDRVSMSKLEPGLFTLSAAKTVQKFCSKSEMNKVETSG